jgi:hypothetical protein
LEPNDDNNLDLTTIDHTSILELRERNLIIQECQPKIVLPIESAPQEEEFANSQVQNAR